MNDKEANAQKRRVWRYYEKWRRILHLQHWDFYHCWRREPWCEDEDGSATALGAKVTVSWQYMTVHIDWYLPSLAKVTDDDELEDTVLHELVHIPVNEMREQGEDRQKHEEHAVTHLTCALLRLERSKGNGKKEAKQGQAPDA